LQDWFNLTERKWLSLYVENALMKNSWSFMAIYVNKKTILFEPFATDFAGGSHLCRK